MTHRFSIYILMIGGFLAVTAELILAGVVHLIAEDLQVNIALAGQLVTAYAIAFAVGAPIVITLTVEFDRKKVMIASLLMFIIANLVACWSPNFLTLIGSRVLLGLSGGVFVVVAMSAISKLFPVQVLGNAIGTFMLGLSGALVLGVPLGVVISGWLNWRFAFGVLAGLSALVLLLVVRLIPSIPGGEAITFRQQLSVTRNGKVISGYFITLFWGAGYSTVFTFLAPYLTESVSMDISAISFTMFVLGIFSMIGTRLGGYSSDRWGVPRTVFSSMVIHAISLLMLPILTSTLVFALVMVAIWIGSAWMTSPALQTYFIRQSPQAPDLALSLNTSVLQIGFALGAGIGGIMVDVSGDISNVAWLGGCIVIIGILAALISFTMKPK